MAERFILTAQLRLQAPQNVKQVYNKIQSQLKGIAANVDFKLPRDANRKISSIKKSTDAANRSIKSLSSSVRSATSNIQKFGTKLGQVRSKITSVNNSARKAALSIEKFGGASGSIKSQMSRNNSAINALTKSLSRMAVAANSALQATRQLKNLRITPKTFGVAGGGGGPATQTASRAGGGGYGVIQQNQQKILKQAKRGMDEVAKGSDKAAKSVDKTSKALKDSASAAKDFGAQSALAVRRFLAFSIPAGVVLSLTVGIRSALQAAVDFDRQMIRVQQVTGRTRESLAGITQDIGKLASGLGVSSAELVDVTRILAQTGMTAKDVKTAMAAIARTDLSPTFESMEQTTEGVVAIMRQFNVGALEIEARLGSLNAVAGNFAVESDDLVQAIRRAGGAFSAAGGSMEELIALFTSVRSTTRESAQSIATGFRTIFTRLQRPTTIRFLRQFGIELQDMAGRFVGPYEAIKRLNTALRDLDPRDERFSRIIEQLGGFRQVSKVIPLVQQFGTAQQALSVAINGTTSTIEDSKTAQQSLSVQLSKLSEEYLILFRDIVQSNTFKFLAQTAMDAASAIADVLKEVKELIPLLTIAFGTRAIGGATQFSKGFLGRIGKFASGGKVGGSGSGDVIPAMLTPGEFVIKKDTAQKLGYDNLKKLNNFKKFARGGVVGRGVTPAGIGNVGGLTAIASTSAIIAGLGFAMKDASEETQNFASSLAVSVLKFQIFAAALGSISSLINNWNISDGFFGKRGGIRRGFGGIQEPSAMKLGLVYNDKISNWGPDTRMGIGRARLGQAFGNLSNRQFKLFGKNLNKASKTLLGLSAAAIGLSAALGVIGVASYALGDSMRKAAISAVDAAKSQEEIADLQRQSRSGSMISAAGTGAVVAGAAGMSIGAQTGGIFGIPGIVVGGILGGLVGAIGGTIYSSFKDGSEEITQAWRQARFDKISENMSIISKEISDGVRSINDVGLFTGGVNQTRKLAIEASAAGNEKEARQYVKELQGQIPALNDMKNSMIDASDNINEFLTDFGTSGNTIIMELARLTGKTASEVLESIQKEIKERKALRDIIEKESRFRKSMFDNILSLQSMNIAVSEVNDRLSIFSHNLDSALSIGGGDFFNRSMMPYANQVDRISSGRTNVSTLRNQLGSIFGRSNSQLQSFLIDVASTIREMPSLINDSISRSNLTSGMPITNELQEIFNNRGLLGDSATAGQKAVANAVIGHVSNIVNNRQSGIDEFIEKFRSAPSKVVEEMMGDAFSGVIEGVNEYSEAIDSAMKEYISINNKRNQFENKILQERLSLVSMTAEHRSVLDSRRNPLRRFGAPRYSMQAFQERQTMLAGGIGMDPVAIGRQLRKLQDEIFEARQNMPSIMDGDDFIKAQQSLNKMEQEATRLSMALKALAQDTSRLSEVQRQLAAMEQARQENFDFLVRYQFADREERMQMNRTLSLIGKISAGQVNLEDLPGQFKKDILSMVRSMPEGESVILGGKTRDEWLFDVLKRGGLFNQDALRRSDPRGKDVPTAEKELREEERNIMASMQEAQRQIIENMQNASALQDKFGLSVDKFVAAIQSFVNETMFGEERKRLTGQLEEQRDKQRDIINQITNRRLVYADPSFDNMSEQQINRALRMAGGQVGEGSKLYGLTKAKETLNAKMISSSIVSALGTKTIKRKIDDPYAAKYGYDPGFETITGLNKQNARERLDSYLHAIPSDEFQKSFQMLPKELQEGLQKQLNEAIDSSTTPKELTGSLNQIMIGFMKKVNKNMEDEANRARFNLFGSEEKFKPLFDSITKSTSAMEKFVKVGENLGDFNTTLPELNAKFKELDKNISTLNERLITLPNVNNNVGGDNNVVNRAKGGSIFKKQGTDTVPAMLTPGEFVVNRRSAQRYRGLLEQINNGVSPNIKNGIMYAADGGPVTLPVVDFLIKELAKRAALGKKITNQDRAFINTLTPEQKKYGSELYNKALVSYSYKRRQNEKRSRYLLEQQRRRESFDDSRGGIYSKYAKKRAERLERIRERIRSRKPADRSQQNSITDRISAAVDRGDDKTAERLREFLARANANRIKAENISDKSKDSLRHGYTPGTVSPVETEHERKFRLYGKTRVITGDNFDVTHRADNYYNTLYGTREVKNIHRNNGNFSTQNTQRLLKEALIPISKKKQDIYNEMQDYNYGTPLYNIAEEELAYWKNEERKVMERFRSESRRIGDQKLQRSDIRRRLNSGLTSHERIPTYHSGGYVNGSGNQLGILQGGEFVLSKGAVQALSGGGTVKGYQGGGSINSDSGSGMSIPLLLSDESKNKLDEFNNKLSSFIGNIADVFSTANSNMLDTISQLPSAFNDASSIIREASSTFEASITTLSNLQIGQNIQTAIESGTSQFTSSINNSFNIFSSSVSSLNSTAQLLSDTVTNFNTSATLIDGAAKQMKDALAQEIQISVNHSHSPIVLRIDGGNSATSDIGEFEQKVMSVVGPEIDKLKSRLRNYGPGIA